MSKKYPKSENKSSVFSVSDMLEASNKEWGISKDTPDSDGFEDILGDGIEPPKPVGEATIPVSNYGFSVGELRPVSVNCAHPKSSKKISYSNSSKQYVPCSEECSAGECSGEEVKNLLTVTRTETVTTIVVLIVDSQDDNNNQIISVKCLGQPFAGHIYEYSSDSYLLKGLSVVDLGRFGFSLNVTLPGADGWSAPVPIPSQIIEKNLSPAQKQRMEQVRKSYPSPRYNFKYVQMVEN